MSKESNEEATTELFWQLMENLMNIRNGLATRKLLLETHELLGMALALVRDLMSEEDLQAAIDLVAVERAKIDYAYKQLYANGGD